MGHLTRYLLKKAFQLFCFYPSLPKGRARLETDFDVGLRQNWLIVHFFCKMESKFNSLQVDCLINKQPFAVSEKKKPEHCSGLKSV